MAGNLSILKFKFRTLGNHVHVSVFVHTKGNFVKSGDLIFETGDEWDTVRRDLSFLPGSIIEPYSD